MREIILYCFESGRCPVEEFFDSLTEKQFEKAAFVLDLIEQLDNVPSDYLKKLKGTDDLWEVRIRESSNIFRLLGFFDGNTFLILNHAFFKKSQKLPQKEIAVAQKRKQDYFQRKGEKI